MAKPKSHKVSIVIPAYNEEKMVRTCIKAILKQTVKAHEILFVDNNSSDNTVKIAESYPEVTVSLEEQQGQAYAQVQGFNKATGDILGRIDADTILPKDWIEKVTNYFDEHPDIGALSGSAEFYDLALGSTVSWSHNYWYYGLHHLMFGFYPLMGNNMALKKSAWKATKDMPIISNKQGHEDMYLAICLHKRGIKIAHYSDLKAKISGRTFKNPFTYARYIYKFFVTTYKGRRLS